MGTSLAGTDLPPSSVHALIEIEARPGITAANLAEILRLEKSSVSRLLRKLIEAGHVLEGPGESDGRTKALRPSDEGRALVAGIHGFARARVTGALDRLTPERRDIVAEGLSLYADALADHIGVAPAGRPEIRIEGGHCPGLLARVIGMHALHYARISGFGLAFEAVVAAGLAAFAHRLDRPCNGIWRAMVGDEIVGSIAIDGEDLGPGIAHLRWFIVEDGLRGRGLGRDLLATAVDFADARGFPEIHLWTFRGLDAARRLYEAQGFTLVEERPGDQWGREVMEQRFVRRR